MRSTSSISLITSGPRSAVVWPTVSFLYSAIDVTGSAAALFLRYPGAVAVTLDSRPNSSRGLIPVELRSPAIFRYDRFPKAVVRAKEPDAIFSSNLSPIRRSGSSSPENPELFPPDAANMSDSTDILLLSLFPPSSSDA
jgi:hypothetical protein